MKYCLFWVLLLPLGAATQELFTLTDAASNLPAHSLSVRTMSMGMKRLDGNGTNWHHIPDVGWGISKKWMIRSSIFLANRGAQPLKMEGVGLYTKYRFLSVDDEHKHFRIAAFARLGTNNTPIHMQELEIMGHNTGWETGLVATQLVQKTAVNAAVSWERVTNNFNGNKFPGNAPRDGINYTLAWGRLMYPKKYTSFKQVNLNTMVELVGQYLPQTGEHFIDVLPTLQVIVNSQLKIDMAYRRQLTNSMFRTAPNGVMLKLEYTFFNIR
ncbi:MAG: hypothetical protein EAZ47_00555 [Bacteroidetes bacterium]|nr:MAG: hypothetical protein EAY72_08135 [Bacteroidota bacterium]TAE64889.1 MAG: hypothetical protein EAY68_06935 [Bacteroidota bacterium]TAF98339.1 MAG: hypothetical protein EAZ47_00555 [Bacteroidota bacterium]